MGWSLHYNLIVPGSVAAEEKDFLHKHLRLWSGKLHEGCESMRVAELPDPAELLET